MCIVHEYVYIYFWIYVTKYIQHIYSISKHLKKINTHNTDILEISWIIFQYKYEEFLNLMDSVAIFKQDIEARAGRPNK